MDQFRVDTENAVEFYLRDPSNERAQELAATLARWPFWDAAQHGGTFLAIFDVCILKHNVRRGLRVRFALWMIRRGCPEWKPTWGDYWLLSWKLTQADRPGIARQAIKQLHRRGWHLPYADDDQPNWQMAQGCARRLIRQECQRNPKFRDAMLVEIAGTPCVSHDIVACP